MPPEALRRRPIRPEALRLPRSFLLLYALAWAGTAIAYMPFLTILLPVRIEAIVSRPGASGMALSWLAVITFAGAIAASTGNILFGWASDVMLGRRAWVFAGLISSSLLLLLTQWATSLGALVAVIVLWQLAINMMIGPLSAWAGDCVPDAQKGRLGGLLACAPAAGALVGALVTLPGLAGPSARLGIVAFATIACVAPLLAFGAEGVATPPVSTPDGSVAARPDHRLVRRMWLARLLVQISEATLFAYLYFWLRSLDPSFGDASTAQIFGAALLVAAPMTLVVGAWADRHGRVLLPLRIGAALAGVALLLMGFTGTPVIAIAGYAVFSVACSIFLALHSAQTLRVLPRSDRRGRDLGFFNLTNTLPSLVMPGLTLALVPALGFRGLFLLLAGLAFGAAALLVPSRDR
jgi:MFS family permease